MEKETNGEVVSVSKQWWLKVNTKAFRKGPMDGAVFPHIIKVRYNVNGKEYTKRKWVSAGVTVPLVGNQVKVIYEEEASQKARITI